MAVVTEASTMPETSIGTHSGTFHCDEALAVFMLQQLPRFRGCPVVRSRDPAVLSRCTCVVDVGAVYDPDTLRFDHHQRGFFRTFDGSPVGQAEEEDESNPERGIKLSSAGLIYKHFGREVVQLMLGLGEDEAKTVDTVYRRVYTNFMAAIDAIDNGVDQYGPEAGAPRYKVSTDLSARVGRLNPGWNEEGVDPDTRFQLAVALTGAEFTQSVHYWGKVWMPARSIVSASIDARFDADPSGEIVVLKQHCPWAAHFRELEEEKEVQPLVKYILFEDQSGAWRVQCVAVREGSFENRKDLLWKGLRDDDLSQASGIDGCVFVHANGFIGGNKTFKGALEMARKSLEA